MNTNSTFSTSKEVYDAYAARSLRANVEQLRSRGIKYVIGKRCDAYIWNLEGNKRVIDCGTGGGVHSLGHNNQEIAKTLIASLTAGHDSGLWSLPNAEYIELSDSLALHSPAANLTRSIITLSASASNDVAIMAAYRMTGRKRVIAFRHGYHGHSGFSALVTGSSEEANVEHFRLPTGYSVFASSYGDLKCLEDLLNDTIAAVILEPINYETFEPAPKGYLSAVSELCRENNSLFILDETRTGLGRTGTLWAAEQHKVAPDVLIVGKGLSGGIYPVGACLMRQEIFDYCFNERHYAYMSSLGGNELSCIVARKVIEICADKNFLAHVNEVSSYLKDRIERLCEGRNEIIKLGSIHGLAATIELQNRIEGEAFYRLMFDEGVLCHSVSVVTPTVLKLLPPLTIQKRIVDEIIGSIERVVDRHPARLAG